MDSGPILEHMHPPLLVDFLAPANPDSEPRALPPLSTATPPLPIPKKPEDFWECFEHAVDSAIPREFAASKSATEAPNPLLRVVDGLEGLSSEDNIDLALPLHPMQVEEIRAKGRFTHIPKVSMDIIPPKCLRILNHAWRIWIQTQAADLVEAKFEIKKVRVDFECAFFSAQGQIVANFGDEYVYRLLYIYLVYC